MNERTYNGNKCISISDVENAYGGKTRRFAARFAKYKPQLKNGQDYFLLNHNDYTKVMGVKTCNAIGGYILMESGFKKLARTMKRMNPQDKEIVDTFLEYFKNEPKVEDEPAEVKYDNTYTLLEKFIENQTKIISEQAKANEELRNMLALALERLAPVTRDYSYSEAPIILKDNPKYAEWKANISKAAKMIIGLGCKYKDENDVLHNAYDVLRTKYGIVFEQEAREYKNQKGRSPVNTKELIYWVETTKETHKNLLIGVLNSMYNELKRG